MRFTTAVRRHDRATRRSRRRTAAARGEVQSTPAAAVSHAAPAARSSAASPSRALSGVIREMDDTQDLLGGEYEVLSER